MTEQTCPPKEAKSPKHGRVLKKTLGQYFVRTEDRIVDCSISNRLRKDLVYPTADPSSIRRRVVEVQEIRTVDPVAIGDLVSLVDAGDGSGMITEVLPRKNKFSRRASGAKPIEQVVVANVDQIVPVFAAAQPAPKWALLDRYLADAESVGIPAVICITKMDLADQKLLVSEIQPYQEMGYGLVLTSAVTQEGLDELKQALKDKVSVLVGKSGVGKTTLLNVIEPGLGLRVDQVSKSTGKGKHTTNTLEMFELGFGGSIIDTPGMREFGLYNVGNADLASLFPEMRTYIGKCRFGANCTHTHEPGCAIKEAVQSGEIAERRYQSYVKMRRSS